MPEQVNSKPSQNIFLSYQGSLNVEICHEETHFIVVNKPPTMPTHIDAHHQSDTLVNWLYSYFLATKLPETFQVYDDRAGIVHRLDAPTSGLLLIAKTNQCLEFLQTQWKTHQVTKKYYAIVNNVLPQPYLQVKLPLIRDKNNPTRIVVSKYGKPAESLFKILTNNSQFSFVECTPITGRTHQLRVHLAALNCPVVGDKQYCALKTKQSTILYLHAYYLQFIHPQTNKLITFTLSLPSAFHFFLTQNKLSYVTAAIST